MEFYFNLYGSCFLFFSLIHYFSLLMIWLLFIINLYTNDVTAIDKNLTDSKSSPENNTPSISKSLDPCILYDNSTKTIIICGGKVNLSQIFNSLNNSQILEKNPDKTWILNSNIVVQDKASFYINNTDCNWLKINVNDDKEYVVKSFGNLLINNTKITSWDSINNNYPIYSPGIAKRGTINIDSDGKDKVVIFNSSLSHLGSGPSHDSSGIYVSSKNKFLIANNTLNNNFNGIYFSNSVSNNIFKNNDIYNNYQHGILFSKIKNLNVIKNNIYNNSGNGINCIDDCSNNNISNNRIYDNNLNGISLIASYNNLINSNIIHSNKAYGLTGSKNSNNTISENIIVENKKGISISSSTYNKISKNLVERNLIQGIELYYKSTKNQINNNFINSSGNNGIHIRDAFVGNNLISNNKIMGNIYGIQFSNSNDNELLHNFIKDNNFDYYAKYGSNNEIIDTTFNNTWIKFFDSTSRFTIVNSNNQIVKNSFGIPNNIFSNNITTILYPIHKNVMIDTEELFILPNTENITYYKQGNEKDTTKNNFKILFPDKKIHTEFIVGNLKPSSEFMINVNNSFYKSQISNSSGYIKFGLEGDKKMYNIQIELNSKPLYMVILLFAVIIIISIIVLVIKRLQKSKK